MIIKICQMGDEYTAPLTFRISRNNTTLTYYTHLDSNLSTYTSSFMDFYINNTSKHRDYGNFIFTGTIWESYYS